LGENQTYIGIRLYGPYHPNCFYFNYVELTVSENWTKNMTKDVVPKLRNSSCPGNRIITSPLAFTEGLFSFLELFYLKRRIFKKNI